MRQVFLWVLTAVLVILPGLVSAQAPAGGQPPAQQQLQAQPGPGTTCEGGVCRVNPGPAPGQANCPADPQMQKQLDELRQRVEALEKQAKGKKK